MTRPVIRAAGGILWRAADGPAGESTVEVAIIHRPRYDDWSFPKGKLGPGESEIEGAIREVAEETGYRVHLGRALGEVRYDKVTGETSRPKVVRYWAMQAAGGVFTPSAEVDELRWVSLDEAHRMLTHARDREVLEKFVRGPALTRIVLVVRHATAGNRSKWEGDDRLRPLDDRGWEQAEALVRLLSRFAPHEIVSADFVRCVQTVLPLSEAIGVAIKEEPLFSELGYPGHEEEAVDMTRRLGSEGSAAVVCSQGDVIPDLIARIASEDHVDTPDPLVAKKGSVWALSFDGRVLVGAEYFPPPVPESPGDP